MIRKQYIFILLLLSMEKFASGQFLCSYFYAYGTDEINVYWDYYFDYNEELLGCNILRYETDPMQAFKLNQELITSPDKNFYYLDTTNIVDSAIYLYRVEFVFENDTLPFNYATGSFKSIEFNNVGPTMIELVAVPKKQGYFMIDVFWDNNVVTTLIVEDTLVLEMDPFDLELSTSYIGFYFYDIQINNFGTILTSVFHLKELLFTQTSEYSVPEISIKNYPNPFSNQTAITFNLPANCKTAMLNICSLQGKLIRQFDITGKNKQLWDGTYGDRCLVPNGVYLYNISFNSTIFPFKKLLFIH